MIILFIILVIFIYFDKKNSNSSDINLPAELGSYSLFSNEKCNDSDNGKIYFIKGIVSKKGRNYSDYCINDNYLKEYYCSKYKFVYSKLFRCLNSCIDGACVDKNDSFIYILPEPGLSNPRLRFATGSITNCPYGNEPEIFSELPNIPEYTASSWYVAQWRKCELHKTDICAKCKESDGLMVPWLMYKNAPSTQDPNFGTALYAFPALDDRSHIWIYNYTNNYVYELHGQNGWLEYSGAPDIFLSVNVPIQNQKIDKKTIYSLKTKVKDSIIYYATPDAEKDGSVMWQYFSAPIFQYTDPETKKIDTLFLQIWHSTSFNTTEPKYLFYDKTLGYIYSGLLEKDQFISSAPRISPLVNLSFDLNKYLCDAINEGLTARGYPGVYENGYFPISAKNLSNWKFISFYMGLETQNSNTSFIERGAASANVLVSDLKVIQEINKYSTYAPDGICL